jgi:2-methylisocitrate lyase-like PEP mutase family enzyme
VARLLDVGAVGCNLEDTDHAGGGLTPIDKQVEYLAEVRAAAGADLVVNARVDVFLRAADQSAVLAEGVERARAYLAAGADCVYPILIQSPLRSFVDDVDGPVNVTLLPEFSVPDLAAAGVARISLGAGLWRRTQNMLREVMAGLRHSP